MIHFWRCAIKNAIRNSFLFSSLCDGDFLVACQMISTETRSFSRGETIYSPGSFERKIGFVVSGECEVCRTKNDGRRVKLNTLLPGDSFGITTVFSSEAFPTVVYAKRSSTVAFITESELAALIDAFPSVALAIIRFQNDRIAFLNKKIETFSAASVEERLACYLLAKSKAFGAEAFDFNRKKASEALGVGRASLYRALDSLLQKDLIVVESKKIIISDLKGLERITK